QQKYFLRADQIVFHINLQDIPADKDR
ncbi:uncharacterized protein METZ01_LOCUS429414, partial [marine metagenome]